MKKCLALGVLAVFMISGSSAALNPDNWYIPDNDRWTEHEKGGDARIQFWCDSNSNCGTQDSAEVMMCGQSSSDIDITETAQDGSYFDVYLDTSKCDLERSDSEEKTVTLRDGGNEAEFTVTIIASSDHTNNMEDPNRGNYLEIRTQGDGSTWVNLIITDGGEYGRDSATEAGDGTTTAYSDAGDILFHDIDHAWGNTDEVCVIKPQQDMGGDGEPIILEGAGSVVEQLGGQSNLQYTGTKCFNSNENGRDTLGSLSFGQGSTDPDFEKNSNIGIGGNRGKDFKFDLNSWSRIDSGTFSPQAEVIRGYTRPDTADGDKCEGCDWDEGPYWFVCRGEYQQSNKEVRVDGDRYQCQSDGVWEQVGDNTGSDGEISIEWVSPGQAPSSGGTVELQTNTGMVATAKIRNVPEASTGRVFINIEMGGTRFIMGSPAEGTNEESIPEDQYTRSCQGSTCTVSVGWSTGLQNQGSIYTAGYTRPNGEIMKMSGLTVETRDDGPEPDNGPFPPETGGHGGDNTGEENNEETGEETDSTGQLRSMSKMEIESSTPTEVDLTWNVGKAILPANSMDSNQLRDVATNPESWTITFYPFGSSAGIKGLMPAEAPAENDSAVTFRFDSMQGDTLLPAGESGEPTSYLVAQDYSLDLNFEPEGGAEQNNQDVYSFTSKQLSVGVEGTNECRLPASYELSSAGMLELVSEAPGGSEGTPTVYPQTVRPSSSCSLLVFLREDDLAALELSEMKDAVDNGNLYLQWGHQESNLETVEYWHTPVTQVERTGTSRYTTYDSSENRFDEENIIVVRTQMTDQAEELTTGEVRDFSYDEYSLNNARIENGGGYSIQGTEYKISIGCSENCAEETSTTDETTSEETDETTDETTGETPDDTTTSNPSSVEYTWWGPEIERQYVNAGQEGVAACDGVDLSSDFEPLQQCQLSIIENCREPGGGCYGRFLQLCDWLSLPDDYGYCPAPSEVSQTYKVTQND